MPATSIASNSAPKLHCDQITAPSTTTARTAPLSVRTMRFFIFSLIRYISGLDSSVT